MTYSSHIKMSHPKPRVGGGTRIRVRNLSRTRTVITINIGTRNWRTKDRPYWYVSNMGTLFTVQCMAVEFFYSKKRK